MAAEDLHVERGGCDSELVSKLLKDEEPQTLELFDPFEAWGRPLPSEGLSLEEVVRASLSLTSTRLRSTSTSTSSPSPSSSSRSTSTSDEFLRLVPLTLRRGEEAVGFSLAALLRREKRIEVVQQRTCRICLEPGSKTIPERQLLVNVCACRGSLGAICRGCVLQAWKSRGEENKNDLSCRVCHQPFVGQAQQLLSDNLKSDIKTKEESKPVLDEDEELKLCTHKITVATKLWQQGQNAEAAKLFSECIAGLSGLPKGRNYELTARHNLALVLHAQGSIQEALVQAKAAKKAFSESFGPEHQLTLKAAHNEAMIVAEAGDRASAGSSYRAVLDLRRKHLGVDHVDTLKTAVNLGHLLAVSGDVVRGEALLRETLASLERVLGRDHPLSMTTLQNLSLAITAKALAEGKAAPWEAAELAREALEGRQRIYGELGLETLEGRRDYGAVLVKSGNFEEGEASLRQALAGMQKVLGFHHSKTQEVLQTLHAVLEVTGEKEKATKLLEENERKQAVSDVKATPMILAERGDLVLRIVALFVQEAHRNHGLGRQAIHHLVQLAQELRAECLEAQLPSKAAAAIDFLKKQGFTELTTLEPARPATESKSGERGEAEGEEAAAAEQQASKENEENEEHEPNKGKGKDAASSLSSTAPSTPSDGPRRRDIELVVFRRLVGSKRASS